MAIVAATCWNAGHQKETEANRDLNEEHEREKNNVLWHLQETAVKAKKKSKCEKCREFAL